MRGRRLHQLAWMVFAASGCEGPQRMLDAHGPAAAKLAELWWLLFLATAIPAAITIAVLLWALRRGRANAAASPGSAHRETRLLLSLGAGIAVILVTLMVFSFRTGRETFSPDEEPAFTIEVVGHQFWWEIRYPDHQIVTANELHIPAGETVRLRLQTADVIHSFWVPQLHGKKDLIPGRVNTWWLKADTPGSYRGQCAEFCGINHALMGLWVFADEPAAFEAWVEQQRQPAGEPPEPLAARGRDIFERAGCPNCHQVEGAFPRHPMPMVGPDLTHFASRRTFAAATFPMEEQWVRRWIRDPQALKPGVRMPPLKISDDELDALVAYLGSLR